MTDLNLLISSISRQDTNQSTEQSEKDALLQHNLSMLASKKSGERFYVINGMIHAYTGFWRIWYLICRIFCGMVVNAALQQTITDSLRVLTPQRVKQILSSTDITATDEKVKRCFSQLFFDRLSTFSQNVFDRDRAISPEVEQFLMEINRESRSNAAPMNIYETTIEKVRLALRLGIDFVLSPHGTSGNYIGYDIRNRKLCKFKPHDEGPYGVNVPRFTKQVQKTLKCMLAFFCTCWKRPLRPSLNPDQEYIAEVWASIVNNHCRQLDDQFDLVPETRLETFTSQAFYGRDKKKLGSCQLWLEGTITEAAVYFSPEEIVKRAQDNDRIKLDNQYLEYLAILAFLDGDQDKAADNWSVLTHEGRSRVSSYDNGISFPKMQPEEWFATRKQHLWSSLPFAKNHFSDRSVNLINNLRASKQQLVEKLKDCSAVVDEHTTHCFTDEQANTLLERLEVLYFFAKHQKPIAGLAEIKTPEEFSSFLAYRSAGG